MKYSSLIISSVFVLNSTMAHGFNSNVKDIINNTETLYLKEIQAYTLPGSIDTNPEHNEQCDQRHSWILDSSSVEVSYNINRTTNMMYATAKLLDNTVEMRPMGIEGRYSFLTQTGIPEGLQVYKIRQIYFNVDEDTLSVDELAISFDDPDLNFQCIAVS